MPSRKRNRGAGGGPLTAAQQAAFARDGYITLPGLLPAAALRPLRRELRALQVASEQAQDSALESTVPPSDRSACQFACDEKGRERVPRQLFKCQGVGLSSSGPTILGLLRHPQLADAALQLSGVESELEPGSWLDAFGTKFFPVSAGGTVSSVGWHDDNYFFGTTRSRTISCVVYLRHTSRASGCLRAVPGSHLAEVVGPDRGHLYEYDVLRKGEYIPERVVERLAREMRSSALDLGVSEGTAVLFDANLLHATWPNASERASERLAFHYIPSELEATGFRGTSFARDKFKDRYVAVDPS